MPAVTHTLVFPHQGGGSPCPVVELAELPAAETMMRLAARFGVETVFLRQGDGDSRVAASLRFFAPRAEMEMCVHGIVAAATVLSRHLSGDLEPLRFETRLGSVAADRRRRGGSLAVTVEQLPPRFGEPLAISPEVAQALNLPGPGAVPEGGEARCVSTSRWKLLVPVRRAAMIHGLRPDFERLWALCDRLGVTGVYAFAPADPEEPELDLEARHFPNRVGYVEDPATGVAACALGAYLTRFGVLGPAAGGWSRYRVRQGLALGRPSLIEVGAYRSGPAVTRTWVRGTADLVGAEPLEVDL